jgi:hypothetical protein
MRKFTAMALALFVVGVALSGCGKTSKPSSLLGSDTPGGVTPTAADIAQTSAAIASNPTLVDDDLSMDPASTVLDAIGWFPGRHRPLRWWRTIDSTTKSIDYVYANPDSLGRPTTAIATVRRHLMGQFHLVIQDSTAADSLRRIVLKPLDDSWVRRLALRRFAIDSTGTVSLWRVVGTSGVVMTSRGATTHIQSLRIQAGLRDTTVTDPLQLHRLPRLMCVHAMVPVHLTVTTDRANDRVFLYRFGDRRPFTNNGDGTYSIDFLSFDFGGLRHVGVNAFSDGTIASETDPYDSQAWIVPFASRDNDSQVDHH